MKKIITAIIIAAAFGAASQLLGQNNLLPKYEFTVNGFGGLSTLNYKVDVSNLDQRAVDPLKLGLGGGGGFGFNYFFTDNWALVTGLEAALYRATLTADEMVSLPTGIRHELKEFKETQNYLALQLPIMAQFTFPLDPQGVLHYYFSLGGRIGAALWGNYHQSFERVYGEDVLPLSDRDFKNPLKFAPLNILGSFETGVRWKLGENLGLYTGLYFDYGFLNITPEKNGALFTDNNAVYSHNSILEAQHFFDNKEEIIATSYTDRVNNLAVGLKIKLAFGGPKKKEFKEPIVIEPKKPAPVVQEVKSESIVEVPQEIKQSMLKLSNTLFAFDKWNLTEEAVRELNKVIAWLNDNPDLHVEIEGHTDNWGTHAYNQELSVKRAKSVYDYFVTHGVKNPSRLSYKGYSFDVPVADNSTPEGRQQNRRADLRIIK